MEDGVLGGDGGGTWRGMGSESFPGFATQSCHFITFCVIGFIICQVFEALYHLMFVRRRYHSRS